MIKAIIFDMDGLLIDSETVWQKNEQIVFGEVGIDISEDMLVDTMGLRSDAQIKYWYDYQPWEGVSFEEIDRRYNSLMEDFFRNESVLMEGVIEALTFFKGKKLPMALASSSTMRLIDAFLDRFNLRAYFDQIHSAELLPHGKPHPEVYLKAAKSLEVDPEFCLALEDSFVGMIAAKAARMKTIVVPAEKEDRFLASDVVLNSLSELNDKVFEKLNS